MKEQLIGDLFVEAQRHMKGHGSKEFSEIFAKLIVRECVEVADNHFESKEPGYPGDKIKQHFGVEE